MPTRTAQLERTRNAIVEAATELLLTFEDPSEYTMQAVADSAGVSHRTLYRHFASRSELIDAVGERLDHTSENAADLAGAAPDVTDLDSWIAGIPGIVSFGAVNREILRRALLLGVGSHGWRSDRDARYWGYFRERFPHLDEETAKQDFAALRHVVSAFNVVLVGERFDLSPEQLQSGLGRAAVALVVDIERRDREAAGRGGR